MPVKIGMPNLGHTMESGKVVEWLKPVGDVVMRGDLLAVVESDKVSMEVEAPVAGTMLAHLVDLQAEVPVGATIALLGEPGETLEPTAPTSAAPTPPAPPAPAIAVTTPSAVASPRRVLASPLARSAAERLGVALADIAGTGPDGLVVRADVERAAAVGATAGDGSGRIVPLAGARKRIAERMSRAWREIPMVPLSREFDVTALAAARGARSWTALFACAVAATLMRHPRLNAWLRGDAIHERRIVDLAVAVALADDIAVPVLRDAAARSPDDLSRALDALIAAARAGTLTGQAQVDATFTLSNLGALGVDSFQPIIDPPQVAILGLGRVRAPGDRRVVSATLVFDHRALDGADGARFLSDLARVLETPTALLS
jgi:pyruvate dehydrogenase E2 component (dihydrolipoamide acetyltransferase)